MDTSNIKLIKFILNASNQSDLNVNLDKPELSIRNETKKHAKPKIEENIFSLIS
jgi:hypothetical protein